MLLIDDASYIQASLSSRLFEFAYKRIFASVELGEHGYQYNKHALVKLPIRIEHQIMSEYSDEYFYNLYNLSHEEVMYIEGITQSPQNQ